MPVVQEIAEGRVPVKVYTGEIEPQARLQLVNISMLPTLPPIAETAASKRARVPGFWTLRTRTVRMSLRSHAIDCSFRHTGDSHFAHIQACFSGASEK